MFNLEEVEHGDLQVVLYVCLRWSGGIYPEGSAISLSHISN